MWLIQITTIQKFLQIYQENKRHNWRWRICSQIKDKKHNHKERNCWCAKHHLDGWKKADRHWTSRIFSPCIRGLEESRQSFSTKSNSTAGRWWSSWILENQVWSSESISTKPTLVGWSLESILGSRRRIQKKMSVLLWCSKNFSLLRAFKGHSGRRLIDLSQQDNVIIQCELFQHVYHKGCAFNLIDDTWRSGFKQETNSILLACWSKRQKTSRSWTYWLLCTTSSTTLAQCMEGTSRRGVLVWYWSCDSKRIDSVKLCRMQLSFKEHFQPIVFRKLWDWWLEKSCMKEHTCPLRPPTKDLITTWSRLDQRQWHVGPQLNNSQSAKLFDSLVEKFNMYNSPNQPNQNPNQSVIDRGYLRTQKMCLLLKVKTSISHEIDEKRLHKELGSSDWSGKTW